MEWLLIAVALFLAFTASCSRHYGLFAGCGGGLPFDAARNTDGPSACC